MRKQFLTIALALLLPQIAVSQEDAKTLLQQALFAEEAEQKLDKAAENYEKVIEAYQDHRDYAVAALYRLAEVRRKQKRDAEAAKLYQRILEEFPKAEPQARLSRETLGAMGIATPEEIAANKIPDDPDETKELRRLMMLAKNDPEKVWDRLPLMTPSDRGWLRVARWMIEHSKKTGKEIDYFPLGTAASYGHLELCKLYLANGAKIEIANGALAEVIANNHDEVGEWLIENGVDINALQLTSITIEGTRSKRLISPLAAAIATENQHWLDRLIELGAEINPQDKSTQFNRSIPPLSIACSKGLQPLVERLLKAGADPNATASTHGRYTERPDPRGVASPQDDTTLGWTPLHYAVNHPPVVATLLKAGADPAVAGVKKITPLHRACDVENVESIRLLLEAGVNPNLLADFSPESSKEPRHLTPVMRASLGKPYKGQAMAAIELLVKHGADVLAKLPDGSTIFDICDQAEVLKQLTRTHLYPTQSKKKSIALAFPASGKIFEIATPSENASEPPSLAQALVTWNDVSHEIRTPDPHKKWIGHLWQTPQLWRKQDDTAAALSSTNFSLRMNTEFPSLRWGDIIEVSAAKSDTNQQGVTQLAIERFLKDGLRTKNQSNPKAPRGPSTVEYEVSTHIDRLAYQTLVASLPCKFTLKFLDEDPVEIEATGGLVVSTPKGKFPNLMTNRALDQLAVTRGCRIGNFEVKRSAALGGGIVQNVYGASLADGDEVTVSSIHPPYGGPASAIQLIEAETKFPIRWCPVPKQPEIEFQPLTGREDPQNISRHPTLFQLIAQSYPDRSMDATEIASKVMGSRKSTWPDVYADILARKFSAKPAEKAPPSEKEVLEAIGAYARSELLQSRLLPHPDFSSVTIRRQNGEGGIQEISVSIQDFIDATTKLTPAAECRAKDIELQQGDIVEIAMLKGLEQTPWSGFDPKTARFFEKALTYDVTVISKEGKKFTETVSWKAPTYYNTAAGPIGMVSPPTGNWGYDAYYVARNIDSELIARWAHGVFLRQGAIIPIGATVSRPPATYRQGKTQRSSPPATSSRVIKKVPTRTAPQPRRVTLPPSKRR